MGIYVDILPVLPVLPDVATVLGIEPQTVLGWGLRVLLYIASALFNGIIGWLAVEHLVKPLLLRWRHDDMPDNEQRREWEAETQRKIGYLEGRLENTEEALQCEQAARKESDRRAEQHEAELEEEKRKPWWRKLLGG